MTNYKLTALAAAIAGNLMVASAVQANTSYTFNEAPYLPGQLSIPSATFNDNINVINNSNVYAGLALGWYTNNSGHNAGFISNPATHTSQEFVGAALGDASNAITGLGNNGQFVQQSLVLPSGASGQYTNSNGVGEGAEGLYFSSATATPVVVQDQLSGYIIGVGITGAPAYSSYVTGVSDNLNGGSSYNPQVLGWAEDPNANTTIFDYNVNAKSYTTVLDSTNLSGTPISNASAGSVNSAAISSNGEYIVVDWSDNTSGDEWGALYNTLTHSWANFGGSNAFEVPASAGNGGTFITGVNNSGEVVGWYYSSAGYSGFAYSIANQAFLNDKIDAPSSLNATNILGVNDKGVLVGYGNTIHSSYLATPNSVSAVPLPAAGWLMLSSLLGVNWLGRRKKAA